MAETGTWEADLEHHILVVVSDLVVRGNLLVVGVLVEGGNQVDQDVGVSVAEVALVGILVVLAVLWVVAVRRGEVGPSAVG